MTELVYTGQALLDLERLSDFLLDTEPQAALDTATLIIDALEILVQHPEIGRKVHFGQRELVISRGANRLSSALPVSAPHQPHTGAGAAASAGVGIQGFVGICYWRLRQEA